MAHHVGEGDRIRYVLLLYDHTPVNDTVKQPEHIPEHLSFAICDERGRKTQCGNNADEHAPRKTKGTEVTEIRFRTTI